MDLYTFQLARWRQVATTGLWLCDITVKSGEQRLAPTWPDLLARKQGQMTEAEYTRRYLAKLDYYWEEDPLFWDDFLQRPAVALGCYCRAHHYCHRYLLTEFLCRCVDHCVYHGELPLTGAKL